MVGLAGPLREGFLRKVLRARDIFSKRILYGRVSRGTRILAGR
jgi:hypothetical protein